MERAGKSRRSAADNCNLVAGIRCTSQRMVFSGLAFPFTQVARQMIDRHTLVGDISATDIFTRVRARSPHRQGKRIAFL